MKTKSIRSTFLFFGLSAIYGTASKAFVVAATSSGRQVEKVTFTNSAINVVGDLFIPKDIDKSRKLTAIVVTHRVSRLKEQTSGLHAQKLAELGFVTFTYDASRYGESGGEPPYPQHSIVDHHANML